MHERPLTVPRLGQQFTRPAPSTGHRQFTTPSLRDLQERKRRERGQ